jgi:hypothetical protein
MPEEYNWPQKIRRYRITCPFQRILVVKHEALIDWSGCRIESAESLDHHLREIMLPNLQAWISPDHPQNHYCKSISLEKMLANPAPHIDEARKIQRSDGEEAARQFLLKHINGQKKEPFEHWWDYMMQQNPSYQKHPAFQYLVLRPVLESSTGKDTRTPIPVNAEALAALFERMFEGRVSPQSKLLPLLCQFMAFGSDADEQRPRFGSDCRWVVITRNDENAADRVAALSRGSGWCVASSSMARSYLSRSDFHLLVEGGRAALALRLEEGVAVEVQGKGNKDPGPWWPRTLLYAAARGVRVGHREHESREQATRISAALANAQENLGALRALLEEQPSKVFLLDHHWISQLADTEEHDPRQLVLREAWMACVRADPLAAGIVPKWMGVEPAIRKAALEAWLALLKIDPLSWNLCPSSFRDDETIIQAHKKGWVSVLKRNPSEWDSCPDFLQKDDEVINACKYGWIGELRREPERWNSCPDFLQKNAEVMQARKAGWIEKIERDPKNWGSCPDFLQKDVEVMQARKSGWIEAFKHAPETNFYPGNLPHDLEIAQAHREIWLVLLECDLKKWILCPDFLQKDDEIMQVRRAGWIEKINRYPMAWDCCPDFLKREFRSDPIMVQVLRTGWIDLFKRAPQLWNSCPIFLQQDVEVLQACETGWIEKIKRAPSLSDERLDKLGLPEGEKKLADQIRKLRLKHWEKAIKKDWEAWERMPHSLRHDERILTTMRETLGPQIRKNNGLWNELPDSYRQDPVLQRVYKFATQKALGPNQ